MNQAILASLLGLAFSTNIFATEDINLDNVVVTAARIPQTRESVIGDITVISREEIERAGQSTLIDILQNQPGIEITSNGGTGKVSGIFIRGTNTNHALVLIDGIKLNSATAGKTTLENLPISLIDRIEILRGPATSLYGQDAIGGVIQIFTKKGIGKPKFYADIGYGTYNTKTLNAGTYGATGDTNFALGVSSLNTDGYSSYKTNNTNFNDNDGYRNLSATASLSYKISQGNDLGLQVLNSKGKSNYDNRYNIYSFDPTFHDNTETTQHSYSIYSKNKITSNWLSTLKIGEGYDKSATSAAGFTSPENSIFSTKQFQWSWQNDFELALGTLTLAYDRLQERVKSTSAFDKYDRNNNGYYLGYLVGFGNHSVKANFRSDQNSTFGTNNTHGLGYGYRLNDYWRTSVSYGTAFKAPTFNDLYYPFTDYGGGSSYQGNPNLKPETSINKEISVIYNNDATNLSITYFRNDISNLILGSQNIPVDTAINLGSISIKGLTLAASQTLDNWHFASSLDIQSPHNNENNNMLLRRANRHGVANLNYTFGQWRLGADTIASSQRYNDSANAMPMDGYATFNLTTEYKINQDWKMQAKLNNIFNKNYALAYDGDPKSDGFIYATAGTNLFVNIRWEPK